MNIMFPFQGLFVLGGLTERLEHPALSLPDCIFLQARGQKEKERLVKTNLTVPQHASSRAFYRDY